MAEPGNVLRFSSRQRATLPALAVDAPANNGDGQPAATLGRGGALLGTSRLTSKARQLTRRFLPIVACLWVTLATPTPAHACGLPGGAITVQFRKLALDGATYTVATQQLGDVNDARSRLLVLDARCRPLWSETVDGDLSHFDVRKLDGVPLLQFVTMRVAGDGTGYVHRLLVIRAGRIQPALPPIEHTGKDGFYLGPLHAGQGKGIVTWTADTAGESEADAHPFVVRTWAWSGGRFAAPLEHETRRKYVAPDEAPSRANFVAKAIGLSVRDQTGDARTRFGDYERIESRVQAAVELGTVTAGSPTGLAQATRR